MNRAMLRVLVIPALFLNLFLNVLLAIAVMFGSHRLAPFICNADCWSGLKPRRVQSALRHRKTLVVTAGRTTETRTWGMVSSLHRLSATQGDVPIVACAVMDPWTSLPAFRRLLISAGVAEETAPALRWSTTSAHIQHQLSPTLTLVVLPTDNFAGRRTGTAHLTLNRVSHALRYGEKQDDDDDTKFPKSSSKSSSKSSNAVKKSEARRRKRVQRQPVVAGAGAGAGAGLGTTTADDQFNLIFASTTLCETQGGRQRLRDTLARAAGTTSSGTKFGFWLTATGVDDDAHQSQAFSLALLSALHPSGSLDYPSVLLTS